jgi:hypothetical protein
MKPLILLLISFFLLSQTTTTSTPVSFTFAASGDHGAGNDTSASLARLDSSGVSFSLALGDFSYSQIVPETAWCDYVRQYYSGPVELVSGNHEDHGSDGLIENFVDCLPNEIPGITGVYGKEYYFDYPASLRLARFILISPDLTFVTEGKFSYGKGTAHYNWLAGAIDEARTAGIPWTIVGMHKVCISAGTKSCEIGADLMNLLIEKKVDLVLQGHDHNYQRSKQLICAYINSYNSTCVVDDGSDNDYRKGTGTVFVISGVFGHGFYSVNATDPEASYFARLMGSDTPGKGYGFMKYTVTRGSVAAESSFSGSFADSFIITNPIVGSSGGGGGRRIYALSAVTSLVIYGRECVGCDSPGTQDYGP